MHFELLDLIVVFIYLGLVLTIAWLAGKNKRLFTDNVNEQYLAGRSLSFWESISSIIATETSALTFLGIPAIALTGNYAFLQIYIGAIFGRYIIARLLLPLLYNKQLTAYSSLSQGKSKKTMASLFILSKLLSVGVRLYSGSILIALFFNIPSYLAIILTLAVTFFYTLFGGLKAVVRTDMLQMVLFLLGGLLAHYIIPSVTELSWGEMMNQAYQAGKMSLHNQNIGYWGYFSGMIAGFLFDIATHGTDQDFMQRLLAGKDLRSSQRAIFFSAFVSILTALIFLGVGSLLWVYSQKTSFPAHIQADQSFAYFITHFFPVGLKGLMLAGILAATMSTIDSTINAICSCLQADLFEKRRKKLHYYVKRDTLLASLGLLGVAFIASYATSVLKLGLTVQSWTAGPMLALFILHIFMKKPISVNLSLFTLVLGLVGVSFNSLFLEWSWHWNTYWGVFLGILPLLLFRLKDFSQPAKL